MTYAMLDEKSGKYAISNKKNFSEGTMMFLDDAERFYNKIKIVKTNEDIIKLFKNADIKENSLLKDFKSKI